MNSTDNALRKRLWFWLPLVAALLIVLAWLFYPRTIDVDAVQARQASLQVTLSDEGETRVRDLFVVSAPLSGFMHRVSLEPGDKVIGGQTVITRIDPADPTLLDARTLAGARAAVEAADFARKAAQAELNSAKSESDYAAAELERALKLASGDAIAKSTLDAARHAAEAAAAQLQQAQANLKMRDAEYQRAQAQLWTPGRSAGQQGSNAVLVRSPMSGVVLRVVTRSESFIPSGTPLVELGDARDLEVKVDLLSADAVKVKAGQPVLIESWGGNQPLHGVVQQVEPFGFTKVSALGIEEQRVRVIVGLTDPPESRQQLGHGYRVEARIIVWESTNALQVPLSSLFRDGDAWAVFVIKDGRAELRHVNVGHQNGLAAEITSGLQPGEWLVTYPDDRIAAGIRLARRK